MVCSVTPSVSSVLGRGRMDSVTSARTLDISVSLEVSAEAGADRRQTHEEETFLQNPNKATWQLNTAATSNKYENKQLMDSAVLTC